MIAGCGVNAILRFKSTELHFEHIDVSAAMSFQDIAAKAPTHEHAHTFPISVKNSFRFIVSPPELTKLQPRETCHEFHESANL
jgi:hypothetical protein